MGLNESLIKYLIIIILTIYLQRTSNKILINKHAAASIVVLPPLWWVVVGVVMPPLSVATVRFGFFRFFVGFFVIENVVIDMTTPIMMGNIAPLHIFHIKKYLFKSMQPILRYSKNNKQLFCMVPKWLTS